MGLQETFLRQVTDFHAVTLAALVLLGAAALLLLVRELAGPPRAVLERYRLRTRPGLSQWWQQIDVKDLPAIERHIQMTIVLRWLLLVYLAVGVCETIATQGRQPGYDSHRHVHRTVIAMRRPRAVRHSGPPPARVCVRHTDAARRVPTS